MIGRLGFEGKVRYHSRVWKSRIPKARKRLSSFTTEDTENTEVFFGLVILRPRLFESRRIYGFAGIVGVASLHRSFGAKGRRLRMTS